MKPPQYTTKFFAGFMTALWIGFYLPATTTEEPSLCSHQKDSQSCVNASRSVSSCAWIQKAESCVPFDPCSASYYRSDNWPEWLLADSKPINGTFVSNASCRGQRKLRSYPFMIFMAGVTYWIHHVLWKKSFIVVRERFAETAGWLFMFTHMIAWAAVLFTWAVTDVSFFLWFYFELNIYAHLYVVPDKHDDPDVFSREQTQMQTQEQGSVPL